MMLVLNILEQLEHSRIVNVGCMNQYECFDLLLTVSIIDHCGVSTFYKNDSSVIIICGTFCGVM